MNRSAAAQSWSGAGAPLTTGADARRAMEWRMGLAPQPTLDQLLAAECMHPFMRLAESDWPAAPERNRWESAWQKLLMNLLVRGRLALTSS